MVTTFTRRVTNGIRWIEARPACEWYSWHDDKGLVNVNAEYWEPRLLDPGESLPNDGGIRWDIGDQSYQDEEKELLSETDNIAWLRGEIDLPLHHSNA